MEYLTLFTDWSQADPRYFYVRGAIWGIVAASLYWKLFVPWVKSLIGER